MHIFILENYASAGTNIWRSWYTLLGPARPFHFKKVMPHLHSLLQGEIVFNCKHFMKQIKRTRSLSIIWSFYRWKNNASQIWDLHWGFGGQKFLSKPLILPALPLPLPQLCNIPIPCSLQTFIPQAFMSIWWPMPRLWLWIDLENFINFFQSLFWKLYQYLPEPILETISISSRAYLGQFINIIQSLSWKAQGLALAFMVRALTGGDSCYKVQLVTILQKIKCQEITMKFELWN